MATVFSNSESITNSGIADKEIKSPDNTIIVGKNFYKDDKKKMGSFYRTFSKFCSTKHPEKRLVLLKKVADLISDVGFDDLKYESQTRIRKLLSNYFTSEMSNKNLSSNKPEDVMKYMLSFRKEEIPSMFFLYSEAFVSNVGEIKIDNKGNKKMITLSTPYNYGLDYIVKQQKGDCGDVSLAAYNIFKKAGIEARVVKAYLVPGLKRAQKSIPIDAHIMCVFKTGSGWAFIDHHQILETRFQSVFEMFCRIKSFRKEFIRARFINEGKWNNCTQELKEPEDGPLLTNEFYDDNFFYVKDRDLDCCEKIINTGKSINK